MKDCITWICQQLLVLFVYVFSTVRVLFRLFCVFYDNFSKCGSICIIRLLLQQKCYGKMYNLLFHWFLSVLPSKTKNTRINCYHCTLATKTIFKWTFSKMIKFWTNNFIMHKRLQSVYLSRHVNSRPLKAVSNIDWMWILMDAAATFVLHFVYTLWTAKYTKMYFVISSIKPDRF